MGARQQAVIFVGQVTVGLNELFDDSVTFLKYILYQRIVFLKCFLKLLALLFCVTV